MEKTKSFVAENKLISKGLALLGGLADKAGYGKKRKPKSKKRGGAKKVVKRRGRGLFGAVGGGLDGMARGLFG